MRRFIQWLLLIAVLVTAGWFLARWISSASWSRDAAERRLSRFLDMDVTVGAVRLEWPFTIVVNRVEGRFSNGNTRNADLHAQEIRLSPCPMRRIEIRRPSIRLVRGEALDWQPAILRGLAPRDDADDPIEELFERVTRAWQPRRSFDISNATILRRESDGEDTPLFGGLSWRMYSLTLEGYGKVRHHRVAFQTRDGKPVGGDGLVVAEWLSARGLPPLRLWSGDSPAEADSRVLTPDAVSDAETLEESPHTETDGNAKGAEKEVEKQSAVPPAVAEDAA